jgi:hypothetical protein
MSFLWKHRTKVVGLTQTLVGSVMSGMSYLQANLKPIHYGISMLTFGVITATLGFINTQIINSQKDEQP